MFRVAVRLLLALIFSPREVWKNLAGAQDGNNLFRKGYLYPVFILIGLSSFIGGYMADEHLFQNAVREMIVSMMVVYGSFLISSYFLNEYLGNCLPECKSMRRSRQFIAYASALYYFLHILTSLLSDLFFLWIFILYSTYMIFMGTFDFIKISEKKRGQFVAVASFLVLLVPFLVKNALKLIVKA